MNKITKDICEKLLNQVDKYKNIDVEIVGVKEEVVEMKETIECDHQGLKEVILKAKELEDKIKNVMSKNTAILDF
jgi:hypothetical protein